jgi:site-specific DNA-cytosine methylase
MGAADVGANHKRDRIWIVAHANNARFERWEQQPQSINGKGHMADTSSKGWEANEHAGSIDGRAVCGSVSQQGENGAEQHLDNTMFMGLEGSHDNVKPPRWIQQEPGQRCVEVSNATSLGLSGQGQHEQSSNSAQGREREAVELVYGRSPDFWAVEPNVGGKTNGLA